ncbi:MAG: APC family permease [Proteobacteria bacterium]|nr:APC family permease [Pseudomonadota bacterium]
MATKTEQGKLQRLLGKGFSIAACIGLVIGLGILRTPGEMAMAISNPVIYMAMWVGVGVFVLLSLAVVAELIAMTPKSGGVYSMIAHAYGPYPGFLIGWTDWIANCAALSLKSVVLVEYIVLLLPSLAPYSTLLAITITSGFAMLQLGGTRLSANVQNGASIGMGLIITTLALALFYGFFINGGSVNVPPSASFTGSPGIAAVGLTVAAVVFTYDGWVAASYFSGEVKSGGRAVAIGSLQGAAIIMLLYVLLNLALVLSVPLPALAGHKLALSGALDLVFGGGGGTFILLAAMFILLAHQNLQYMIAARILYALSTDGLGSRHATGVSDKGTPAAAVIFSWLTVVVLIVAGKFAFLLNLVTILFMAMYVALIVGVFQLRRQKPAAECPFRAWGFPATGIFCALGWLVIGLFVAYSNPDSAMYGLILVLISAPIYFWLKSRRGIA